YVFFSYRRIQRYDAAVTLFPAAIINQAASDQHGRIFQEGTPGAGIPADCLVKGHHGDTQLIVLPLHGRTLYELCRFRFDKGQVCADQVIRCLYIFLCRIDLLDDFMFIVHAAESLLYIEYVPILKKPGSKPKTCMYKTPLCNDTSISIKTRPQTG